MSRSLEDIADDLGISYRRAYHWLRRGLLEGAYYSSRGVYLGTDPAKSGSRIRLTEEQEAALGFCARLVTAGMSPSRAAPVARELAAGGATVAEIGPGLVLFVNPVEPPAGALEGGDGYAAESGQERTP